MPYCDKVSPRERRHHMPPPAPMEVRSKNRGGSASVRERVRNPHISGGRRWLSCRQPACLYSLSSCAHKTDGRTYRRIALFRNAPPPGRGHNNRPRHANFCNGEAIGASTRCYAVLRTSSRKPEIRQSPQCARIRHQRGKSGDVLACRF